MPNANRRGFALPAAIGALVIVGVLVTAGFYMARQELRIGVASRHSSMAVNVAQSSINSVLVNHTQALTPLLNWGDTTLVDTADVGVTRVHVTRLAQRLFYLDATTRITEGGALWSGATRRVGVVTRLSSANMEPPAALTTQGSVKVGGASMVNGYDSIPSTWGGACDISSLKNKPGLMIDDSTQITTTGGKFDVYGNPAVEQDSTITSATLLDFGDFTWNDLVGLAQITYPVGTTTLTSIGPDSTSVGGSYICRQTTQSNWGDPRSLVGVCSNYFPIIYSAGDMSISGGYGQGILLVEGNLKVDGGFEFYGPVYVKGQLSTQGTGGHFNGGVVAANVDLGTSTVLGNALVSFSSCAVSRAVLNNSALTRVRPLAMRSWMDLSNVMN
jgi:hypothetical protein